jgi:hypothetical protein
MKQKILAPNTVPTANIAVNKSRLKVYNNAGSLPTYYLQKGQEFMIELANPTTDVVLAKVILNGKAISQGGLVLKPGQRVFLERYLDVAKKFLFDTYEVSGSEEMKAAIVDNGDIKVEFYRERQVYSNPYSTTITTTTYPNNLNAFNTLNLGNYNGGSGTPAIFLRSSNTTLGLNNLSGTVTNTGLAAGASYSTQNTASSFTSSLGTLDSLSLSDDDKSISPEPTKKLLKSRGIVKSSLKSTIETGRVEKGSDSNQEFKYVNKSFEYSAFHTIEYKMLPISQKINTTEDISVKVYCTNCGAKLGKKDKFCASCGTKK